jgi:transcriptional regulator with XRE-family HTH domain
VADGDGGERNSESGPSRLRDLGSYIRDQRNRAQLSLRNLAKLAGVSNPYLSQIERGLRKPSAEILQAIAKALRISAETLYVKAGILEERGDEFDVEAALALDSHLTDAQKQALIEMYRSFRQLVELRGEDDESRGLRGLVERLTSTGDDEDGEPEGPDAGPARLADPADPTSGDTA